MMELTDEIDDNLIFDFEGNLYSNDSRIVLNNIEEKVTNLFDFKTINHITVELLQQFSRFQKNINKNRFSFKLAFINSMYIMNFSTNVLLENSKNIQDDIGKINNLDYDELKKRYRQSLKTCPGFVHKDDIVWNLYLIEIRRRSNHKIFFKQNDVNGNYCNIEFSIYVKNNSSLKKRLSRIFENNQNMIKSVINWHSNNNFVYINNLYFLLRNYKRYNNLCLENKLNLFTDETILKSYIDKKNTNR